MTKNLAYVAFAMVFAVAACNSGKAGTPNPVNPGNSGAGQATKPAPTSNNNSVIQGTWETACEKTDVSASKLKRIIVDRNVLAYQEVSFYNDICDSYEEYFTYEQYAIFSIEQLQDAVMTHKVNYLKPSGEVTFSWVLRLTGNTFLSSEIEFLQDRNTSHYNDTYTKK